MRVRTVEAMDAWTQKIESIKRKVSIAERMANMEQGESRSYWQYYRNMLMKRFDREVRHHDYSA